ncbi:MAG: hypothetical protein WCU90_15640 [Kiritimatiellia bacterium]
MNGKTALKHAWAVCDRLLLLAVFVLLGVAWHLRGREDAADPMPAGAPRKVLWRRPEAREKTVEGLRVSTGGRSMSAIARSMVESDWERIPSSPAMDIREDGKSFEILFALPEGVARESVRVTTAGSTLTLAMRTDEAGGGAYLKHVRLPCRVERAANVQSVISNNVLRVRIQAAEG